PRHPYAPGEPTPGGSFDGAGPLLVLLATPDAPRPWAERAAAALAQNRAAEGRRVCLVDLALRAPGLHRELGAEAGAGLSDVLLCGASRGRVVRPVSGSLVFAPAGTPAAAGSGVLASPRWAQLAGAFQRAGAELLAFLPA